MMEELDLKKVIKAYVDNLDKKLNSTELSIDDKNEDVEDNQNYSTSSVVEYNNYFVNTHSLISMMISSKDRPTRNLGYILRTLAVEFPYFYQPFSEKVKRNLRVVDNYVIYDGEPIDDITFQSTIIVLRKNLSKRETSKFGVEYLNRLIDGEMDPDLEFQTLISILIPYTRFKNQNMLGYLIDVLKDRYEHGNKDEVLHNVKKLVNLVVYSGLKVYSVDHTSFYSPIPNAICIDAICHTPEMILHEFGHAMDWFYSQRDKKSWNEQVLGKARAKFASNPQNEQLIRKLNDKMYSIINETTKKYDDAMIEKYGSLENAYSAFERYAVAMINTGQIKSLLSRYGVPEEIRERIYNNLQNGRLDIKQLAITLYNCDRSVLINRYLDSRKELLIMDIISAVFRGRKVTMANGGVLELSGGHFENYYRSNTDASFTEIVANINALIVNGDKESLDLLREILGDEFMDFAMREHNTGRIIKSGNEREIRKAA